MVQVRFDFLFSQSRFEFFPETELLVLFCAKHIGLLRGWDAEWGSVSSNSPNLDQVVLDLRDSSGDIEAHLFCTGIKSWSIEVRDIVRIHRAYVSRLIHMNLLWFLPNNTIFICKWIFQVVLKGDEKVLIAKASCANCSIAIFSPNDDVSFFIFSLDYSSRDHDSMIH